MTDVQKIVLIALLALAALALIVSLTLGHHIGGFLRTVEREAQQEAEAREAEARTKDAAAQDEPKE